MNVRALVLVLLLAIGGFGTYAWTRYQAVGVPGRPHPEVVVSVAVQEPEKHKVTPAMLVAAEARAKRPAPPFEMIASDGTACDLAKMAKDGPIVLVFIKDGCPCSVSAEAYFNQLHAAYRGRIRFVGVIDGDRKLARKWGALNGVPFPILPDPKLTLMQSYGATNSAYVALIDRDGQIEEFWPGYSASMLHDLNAKMAKLAGLDPETVETPDAPEDLYSGCPFQ
ncbi:MAG: resA 17 [Planctomycetota bacterium]|nr:resA 17 [Planctomycetota bacterium]